MVAIDGATEDVAAIVKSRTGGLGADVVIVCAPARQPHESAINYARKGGAISFFASLPKDASIITLDSRVIHYSELRVIGASDSRPEHVKRAVEFMAQGKIDADRVITHHLPLEEIHAGLALMKERKSLKVLMYPRDPANDLLRRWRWTSVASSQVTGDGLFVAGGWGKSGLTDSS